ncbi:hypothetical protein [Ancylobacter sp. Lp-2]|nr:hypothetical protein [Ancylobacter sp. Lp-2]
MRAQQVGDALARRQPAGEQGDVALEQFRQLLALEDQRDVLMA